MFSGFYKLHEYEELNIPQLLEARDSVEKFRSHVEQGASGVMRWCDEHSRQIQQILSARVVEMFAGDDPLPPDLRRKLRLLIAACEVPERLERVCVGIVSRGRTQRLDELTELEGYSLWGLLGGEHAVA